MEMSVDRQWTDVVGEVYRDDVSSNRERVGEMNPLDNSITTDIIFI
jgi:hypothetical protein